MRRLGTRRRLWQKENYSHRSASVYSLRMPRRETKRGEDRTPIGGSRDVVVCGASFAGLTVARELAGTGADVLVCDRYEIGERQTSACAAPTGWLRALGLEDSIRQTFGGLVIHTPHTTARMELPWTFSTFDYRTLCEILWDGCEAEFETAKVDGRLQAANGDGAIAISTDRGVISAPAGRRLPGLAPGARQRRERTSRPRRGSPGGSRSIHGAPRRSWRSGSSAASSRPAMAGVSRPGTRSGSGSAPSTPASTSSSRPWSWRSGSESRASATRATGSPTGSARRPTPVSSSPATPPGTACR